MIPDPRLPRFREIEAALRARIAALRPGDPLPSDAALCREFGVSRMTARNAMQRLVDDGLVVRMPGRGTCVAQPGAHRRADQLQPFSREMERRGRRPTSRLLGREVRPATPQEAVLLGLGQAEPVVLVRRVRLADGEPIAIETAVLVGRAAPAVMAADVETGSLHRALADGGIHLRRGRATIRAEAATEEDAHLLGVGPGAPLLVEQRVIRDVGGRPVEATESRYPAGRYGLDVAFEMEAAGGPADPVAGVPAAPVGA
ncbi:MAG: putative GntR-family transcriptional regulator [Chloroflexi bacterium]|nr:putative GntR-family transcriptional regulator [Chloroflexota bacterium]